MDRKKEVKIEIPIGTKSSEGFGSPLNPKSSKAKMMEGLKRKDHLTNTFYVDAYKRVPKYSDLFKKEDHNILENLKSKTRKK